MRSRLVAAAIVGVLLFGACGFSEVRAAAPETIDASPAGLRGLSFRNFLDASFKQILIRDPEAVTKLGLSATFGMRDDALTDVSPEFILEECALCKGILDILHEYDRAALSDADQLSYDIYEWYLDDTVRGEPYAFHDYPITALGAYGWSTDASVVALFTDYQPLVTEDDLANYMTRLSLVGSKMTQLVDALRYREERGIYPAQISIYWAISRIRQYLGAKTALRAEALFVRAEETIIWASFIPRLNAMVGLSSEAKDRAVRAVRDAIRWSFIPGYVHLLAHLEGILSVAPEVGGATSLPDGEAYYAYELRARTTLDLSAAEIHGIGLSEVDRIQTEMRALSAELGLSTDLSLYELLQAANADAPTCDLSTERGRKAYLEASQRAVDHASEAMERACSLTPAAPLEIRAAPPTSGGSFFSPAPLDGSRPGVFYVNIGRGVANLSGVPALAFHEGIPGHYFQMTIAQGLDLPLFRRCWAPASYVEGWAVYSEWLAADLGLYASPIEDLARLASGALGALTCVAGMGVHRWGWSPDEAATYLETGCGSPAGSRSFTAAFIVAFPGHSVSYTVGMLKFVELRERAEAALGADFSMIEFHDLVLGSGPMPLEILERLVGAYIARKLAG